MKILHCITGLTGDGAQKMLLRLVRVMSKQGFEAQVVNLGPWGPLVEAFEQEGVPVHSLNVNASLIAAVRGVEIIRRIIQRSSPDVLQGWMYHANVLLLAAQILDNRPRPIIWNVRRGMDDYKELSRATRLFVRANALFSNCASQIIYCSSESRRQHEEYGFCKKRGVVIGNGFDVSRYQLVEDPRSEFRARIGCADSDVVIGNVGRFDIAKGHRYLIEAFKELVAECPNIRLACVGRGMDESNVEIMNMLDSDALRARIHLLGERSNLERVYPGFDIFCSSSIGEGFPNALSEALACAVPCVATDTGASRELVDGVGIVVKPRDTAEIVAGLRSMIHKPEEERRALGAAGRERISSQFALTAVADCYAELYRECVPHYNALCGSIAA